MTTEPVISGSKLLPAERVAIFEEVWGTINNRYYDANFHGVNWRESHDRYRPRMVAAANDVEFYALFEVMLAELRDAHTLFTRPPAVADAPGEPKRSVGFWLGQAEHKTIIVAVEPDSDAARAGVLPGMVLRAVNNRPLDQIYAEIRLQLAGSSSERAMKSTMEGALLYGAFLGPSRSFGIEGFDGHEFTFTVAHPGPGDAPPLVTGRRLKSGYGYIKFDQWKPPVADQFKLELAKLMDGPGLILDLRGNGGGQNDVLIDIASSFFPEAVNFGIFKGRDGDEERITTHKLDRVYQGRVVILVDEESASASEVFTASMQEQARARVIGRQTCGCVLNQASKSVQGGGTLRWSARLYQSPRGRVLEGPGITPDEAVDLRILDLRRGRDAALEAAERSLRSK